MEKVITYENLRSFCYSADRAVKGPIRGISFEFFGLDGQSRFDEDPDFALRLAEHGIVQIMPYYDPWAWMNRRAVDFVDEIVDVLIDHYGLPGDFPVVSCGGSMGGLGSLVYARYAKRTPVAVVANCPVCDLVAHYGERADLPRTLYWAFGDYDEPTLEDALKTASPLHLAPTMPKIPYTIYHGDADTAVNIDANSRRFVEEMRRLGHDVTFHVAPGCGHCDLPSHLWDQFLGDIIAAVDRHYAEK